MLLHAPQRRLLWQCAHEEHLRQHEDRV
jgi:hypothetical protein